MSEVVVVSNRGPSTLSNDGGGAGGLVSGLKPHVMRTGARWVAVTDGRGADEGGSGAEGRGVDLVEVDEPIRRAYADVISNATLWYLHHDLWDRARRPRFDRRWWRAFDSYRRVNELLGVHIARTAPPDATVLVQDYHLSLLAVTVHEHRDDLRTVHFHHTPFAPPETLDVLPPSARGDLLAGLAANDACGFHREAWADRFGRAVGPKASSFVSPLTPHVDELRAAGTSAGVDEALGKLDRAVGGRFVLGRVDRIDPAKNILRSLLSYEMLLDEHPSLRGDVVFVASLYLSRTGLADYVAYRQEVEGVAARIGERFATDDWQPVLIEVSDDRDRALAVLRRFDALVVTSIADGLNLVSLEGPVLNERDGTVLLTPGCGSFDLIGDLCVEAHPYDVAGLADQYRQVIELSADERRTRADQLRARIESFPPHRWWADNCAAAGR